MGNMSFATTGTRGSIEVNLQGRGLIMERSKLILQVSEN